MTFLSSIVKTILLGIIQGITEWLPISSTGHLILFASIWPLEPATFFEVFKVVIQFGSILAVLVLYYQKLNPFDTRKSPKKRKQTLQLWSKVIVGVIPAAIMKVIEAWFKTFRMLLTVRNASVEEIDKATKITANTIKILNS